MSTPLANISDARHLKLLSLSASCDLCKSSISIPQKKTFDELYQVTPFPVVHAMYAKVTLILIFPIQTSIKQKSKHTPLVLHYFVKTQISA